MGTASRKGPAGGTVSGQNPSLHDATPAERLDWLEGALAEAYESGALSRPTESEEGDPFKAAAASRNAVVKKRKRKKRGDSAVAWELERAGSPALAFINAGLHRRDDRRKKKRAPPARPFATYTDVVQWALRMGFVTAVVGEALSAAARKRPRDAVAAFAEIETLRRALGRIFTTVVLKREVAGEDLAVLNGCLRRRGREVFPRGDGFRRDWGGDGGDLERLLWPLADSAAELLASKKLSRVRQCAAEDCYRLFVAGNKRRLWCDASTCGSRDKGRRYMDMHRRADARAKTKTWRDRQAERERDREAMEKRRKERQALMAKLDQMREEQLRESEENS